MFIAPIKKNCIFENDVYQAFPQRPIPINEWDGKSAFSFEAKRLLTGRTWPEVVGNRLNYGEMDLSLSIWMDGCVALRFFHLLST